MSAQEEQEYTIEKQVVGMGYMCFYDEEDMRNQIVYCSNGCWKLKGDKTARDEDGDLCITDDEEDEEELHRRKVLERTKQIMEEKLREQEVLGALGFTKVSINF